MRFWDVAVGGVTEVEGLEGVPRVACATRVARLIEDMVEFVDWGSWGLRNPRGELWSARIRMRYWLGVFGPMLGG